MSDPIRYRSSEADPLLRAALDAGAGDRAPEGTEDKILATLGLATLAGAAGASGAGAAGAGAKAAVGAGGTKLKVVAGAAFLKWGLAIVVAGGVGTAWVAAGHPERPSAPPPPPPPVAVAVAVATEATAPARLPLVSVETDAAPVRVEPPPLVPAVSPPPPPHATTTIAPHPVASAVIGQPRDERDAALPSAGTQPMTAPSSGSGLAEERALLAEANTALRNRDAVAANRALDRYEARFAHGSMAVEAEALRVEAAALVDPQRARALAREFVERHPASPVTPRVRRLAGGATTE